LLRHRHATEQSSPRQSLPELTTSNRRLGSGGQEWRREARRARTQAQHHLGPCSRSPSWFAAGRAVVTRRRQR